MFDPIVAVPARLHIYVSSVDAEFTLPTTSWLRQCEVEHARWNNMTVDEYREQAHNYYHRWKRTRH